MIYLNRVSQPSPLMDFSRQGQHGNDESLEQNGTATRHRSRESGGVEDSRSFAGILDRLIGE